MKLIVTSLSNGYLKHEEIALPSELLDLSIELESGPIFQINVSDDETEVDFRETTYRKLAIMPGSANGIKIKGV